MKTSATFTFLFVTLMIISLISCSQLRMTRPACTQPGVDRNNCDESKNKVNNRFAANQCQNDNHCAAGRKCSKHGMCR